MLCIRAKFTREENVRFISHLDIMRVFERALRRARLPVKYSEGYNPRPAIVFGLPLPVGVTSEAEYADFELTQKITPQEFLKALSMQLPGGLKLVAAAVRKGKENIMASVDAALYDMVLYSKHKGFKTQVEKCLDEMLNSRELSVEKNTKRGPEMVDIRPLVIKAEISHERARWCTESDYGNNLTGAFLTMLVSAGSRGNLKPVLFVKALESCCGLKIRFVRVHRRQLYVKKGDRLVTPL